MFRFVLVLVIAVLYSYLGLRLTNNPELATWASYSIWLWLFLVFGFVLILPFFFWRSDKSRRSKNMGTMMHLSHQVMAYLNFLIPVVLIRDFVGLVFSVFLKFDLQWMYSPGASLAILLLPFAFKIWGRWTIQRGPQIVRKEIADRNLSPEFSGLRILQISDLHIGHSLQKGFVEKVVLQVQQLQPDLVVLTGDIVDGPAEEFQEDIAKLQGLRSPRGVYFVPGNHEYYWGFRSIEKFLQKAGITSLTNQTSSLRGQQGEILIAGIPDPAAAHFGEEAPWIEGFSDDFKDRQYRILLSHQPSLADRASKAGFHFQMSGHTHGGQFFPWNLLIGFFQKYSKGLYQIGKMNLYVNQGTGYWGPALRIGTHCEITEIVLNSQG
jgi:hypothetical protein